MAAFDLVFSGGGTKAVAFLGALEALERRHTHRRLVGSSAGAITAALLAAGYSARELIALAEETTADGKPGFAEFLSPPNNGEVRAALRRDDSETRAVLWKALRQAIDKGLDALMEKAPRVQVAVKAALAVGGTALYDAAFDAFLDHLPTDMEKPFAPLLSFLEFGGFFSTAAFTTWLAARLRKKSWRLGASSTLADFHRRTGRDLSIVAADTTAARALVLNHRTAPDCPVVQAVRMSMSVPMVWQEVPWAAAWGKYLGEDMTGHLVIDGGAVLNFPLRYLVQPDDPVTRRVMGDPPKEPARPLGLLLDERLPVAGDVEPPAVGSKVVARLGRLIDTITRWEDEAVRPHEAVVCRVPVSGYNAMEFAASAERLGVLINSGRCAMVEHLNKRKLT